MFRFVVLSALVAIAAAAPGYDQYDHSPVHYAKTIVATPSVRLHEKTIVKPEYTVVEQPTVQHVGNVVKSFPSAVSHQSSTVVHNKASVVEPIYAHGVQKSVVETPKIVKQVYAEPTIEKTIVETPIAYSAPAYTKTYAYEAPAYTKSYAYEAPAYKSVAYSAPVYTKAVSYEAPAYAHAAPLAYASYAEPLSYSSYKHY